MVYHMQKYITAHITVLFTLSHNKREKAVDIKWTIFYDLNGFDSRIFDNNITFIVALNSAQMYPKKRYETYGLCGDNVFLLTFVEASHALHCDVIRLCRSACEDNLPWIRADQVCHLLQI